MTSRRKARRQVRRWTWTLMASKGVKGRTCRSSCVLLVGDLLVAGMARQALLVGSASKTGWSMPVLGVLGGKRGHPGACAPTTCSRRFHLLGHRGPAGGQPESPGRSGPAAPLSGEEAARSGSKAACRVAPGAGRSPPKPAATCAVAPPSGAVMPADDRSRSARSATAMVPLALCLKAVRPSLLPLGLTDDAHAQQLAGRGRTARRVLRLRRSATVRTVASSRRAQAPMRS